MHHSLKCFCSRFNLSFLQFYQIYILQLLKNIVVYILFHQFTQNHQGKINQDIHSNSDASIPSLTGIPSILVVSLSAFVFTFRPL